MATHNLWKLKIKTGEDGLAFRFGDGKIFRIGGKGKGAASDDYADYDGQDYSQQEYVPGDRYAPKGYTGRFAQPQDDYDDRYADEYEDDYQDGYADDYEDGYADDYGDDGYYDEGDDYADDRAYDDRYLDEDAQGYDDDGYGDESPLMRYVDENDWVTYLLLVVLPPLGIYLLWRRRRFEVPIRWGVSAASAIWFVIMLILLVSLVFTGSGDTTTNPPIEMVTPTPTVAVQATAKPADASLNLTPDDMSNLMDQATTTDDPLSAALAVDATATPIPGANGAVNTGATGNTVIMTATGAYYHNNASCENIGEGASVSNVTRDVAEQRGKVACPICYPNQEIFYATATGTYYHAASDCSNMKNASVITKEAAAQQGKLPCPVCVTKEINTLDSSGLKFADANTKDQSGMTVYATAGGRYFHVNATCSGMQNAMSGSLLNAMLAGKTACPTCCAGASRKVWCTEGGTYFHNKSDCSGMEGAYQVNLAEAMIIGKKKCKTCWGSANVGTGSAAATGTSSGSGSVFVYGTKNGKYYHTNATCSGMSGATQYTLKSMIASGRAACPTCCSGAETVVYATEGGTYYHSYASCSGMTDAQAGTLAQALAYGKKKCSACWSGGENATGKNAILGETASGSYVYATQGGTYYHVKSNCSGMTGASKITVETAVKAKKTACPTCAPAAKYNVYSTENGTYYHRTSDCSGMSGATQRTIEEAVIKGQAACPVCITSQLKASSSSSKNVSNVSKAEFAKKVKAASSNTFDSGTSGIKVYATATSDHYHTKSNCSGMKNASRVSLETAMNYGKTACSKCASSANTSVYAVKNGKYYHYSKDCAGAGATRGKRAYALALGLDACPYCVTKTKSVTASTWKPESGKLTSSAVSKITEVIKEASSDTYNAGKSGIKVYASVKGKYYHSSKSCAGSGASKVTLETALNYGKSACPSCASSASKKVYSSGSDKYYHSSKTCAGSGAVSGSFAKALAMGKKECPVCIGGSEAYEVSDVKYSAPGDTSVYIDLGSNMLYYHKNSKCSDAGLSGGTKVMLDFVVSWGYRACPYCNPATSVK